MKFNPGDRVAYGVQFLRSIGCCSGDMPAGRGRVVGLSQLGSTTLVEIKWEGSAQLPTKVNAANLAIVGPNRRFANID